MTARFGLYLVNLLADAGYELFMQGVSTRLIAETEVMVEWDKCLLCLRCWLPAAGWGNSCPLSPRRLLRLLALVLEGIVGLSPLLDLLQHPKVLLVAGDSSWWCGYWQLNCIQNNFQAFVGECCWHLCRARLPTAHKEVLGREQILMEGIWG